MIYEEDLLFKVGDANDMDDDDDSEGGDDSDSE